MFADGEDQARECIAEQDRPKIKNINKSGTRYNNYVVTFESHEIAEEVLKRSLDQARKVKNSQGKSPRVEWFRERGGAPAHQRETSGGFGSRGASSATGPSVRGGYTSGGERASDSEGGRGGRGAFNRGGRGRGERGRGRGMGAGRGSFQNKGDGAAESRSADSKPAVSKD